MTNLKIKIPVDIYHSVIAQELSNMFQNEIIEHQIIFFKGHFGES